ncbi:MAG: M48 family metallopeptidase, partial [Novosphingobium sp.]
MTSVVLDKAEPLRADMHDGLSARSHPVSVAWGAEGLLVAGEDIADRIEWDDLTWIDSLPEAILLGRAHRQGWRLRLGHDAPADLVARLPRRPRFGRWIDAFGFGKSLACCAAISSLVGLVVLNTPSWLGRKVPISWETGMSDDGVEDLSASTCHTPGSEAALAQLVGKLDRDNSDGHLPRVRVELIKLDYVNAVALPGGRVLVFDGLLKQVGSADALAGVIGHEIGHVRERHVMQAMLREFGISMILSGFRSGMTNTLGRMTALRYSREAEAEADDWARARLAEANISPIPIANFFVGTAEQDPYSQSAMAAYLNSHPDPVGRAKLFRAAYRSDLKYRPALNGGQFDAIRYACEDDT